MRLTGSGGTWFSYSYDAASNETQRYNMFNNVAQNYGRDELGRMSQRHIYSPAAGNISVEHYYYDAMSRLSSTYREEDSLSDSFGHDASGQLTGMNSPRSNRWINYNWDNAGNRTQVNDNGWAYSYGVNSLNQYAWSGDGGGVGNGSEHEVQSYQGITYGYYGDTRLASVSGPGGNYNLYYDGLGRTVQRSLNGVTTYYVYDGDKPIYEYKADGSAAGWNVYGKGIDEPLMRADYVAAPGGQGYFFQQDHEGSVTHPTGWGGEVIESYRYDAFGAPTTAYSAGSFNNRFKFTGREYLPQFGIYEYRNRAYHPGLGRFMSEDPSGFSAGDYNLFRYCHNDPVDRSDPTGLTDVNYVGDDEYRSYVDGLNPKEVISVSAHGTPLQLSNSFWGGKGRIDLPVKQVAADIQTRAAAKFSNKDMAIRLYSCRAGDWRTAGKQECPAQRLARETSRHVQATGADINPKKWTTYNTPYCSDRSWYDFSPDGSAPTKIPDPSGIQRGGLYNKDDLGGSGSRSDTRRTYDEYGSTTSAAAAWEASWGPGGWLSRVRNGR